MHSVAKSYRVHSVARIGVCRRRLSASVTESIPFYVPIKIGSTGGEQFSRMGDFADELHARETKKTGRPARGGGGRQRRTFDQMAAKRSRWENGGGVSVLLHLPFGRLGQPEKLVPLPVNDRRNVDRGYSTHVFILDAAEPTARCIGGRLSPRPWFLPGMSSFSATFSWTVPLWIGRKAFAVVFAVGTVASAKSADACGSPAMSNDTHPRCRHPVSR